MSDRQRTESDNCRNIRITLRRPRCENDADRLLDALKYARIDLRLISFRGAIDYPNVVAFLPKVIAHALKTEPTQKPSRCNKTHDAFAMVRMVVKDLPCRPPPEKNIESAQFLYIEPKPPFAGRNPISQGRTFRFLRALPFDPTTEPLRFLFIGRVSQDDCDRLFPLDLVRVLSRGGERSEYAGDPFLLLIRVAKRVSHEHPQ